MSTANLIKAFNKLVFQFNDDLIAVFPKESDFKLSNELKIKGDMYDEIDLPEDAVQSNSDDLYLYYALNDIEIGVSVDLIII